MKNSTILTIVAAVLLVLVVGVLAWNHISELNRQLLEMGQTVENLSGQLEDVDEKASRAKEAAQSAEVNAGEAAQRAEQAIEREQESVEQARQAQVEREAAVEGERLALEETQEARRQAFDSDLAREAAEQERAMAEQQSADAQRAAAEAREDARVAREETARIKQRLEQELGRMERALGRLADTRRTALGVVLTLDSKQIEFDFNKADLRPRNRELLSRIAGVLMTFDDYSLQIFGHTDDVGEPDYNMDLSKRRAQSVLNYLAEVGIDKNLLSATPMGESSPLIPEQTPEARQRNRRVELAIVFSEGDYEALAEDADGSGAQ